jgi:hypothetical protein
MFFRATKLKLEIDMGLKVHPFSIQFFSVVFFCVCFCFLFLSNFGSLLFCYFIDFAYLIEIRNSERWRFSEEIR